MKKIIGLILIVLTIGVFIMNYEKETEVAVISTKYGDMIVEFYPDVAPMHVESFVALANEKYFDGTTFHRVIPDFVIQAKITRVSNPNHSFSFRLSASGKAQYSAFAILVFLPISTHFTAPPGIPCTSTFLKSRSFFCGASVELKYLDF